MTDEHKTPEEVEADEAGRDLLDSIDNPPADTFGELLGRAIEEKYGAEQREEELIRSLLQHDLR